MDEVEDFAELGQIAVYLARPTMTPEDILSWAELNKKPEYQIVEFEVEDAKCEFIYFESNYLRENPPWLDFANEKIEDDKKKIIFTAKNRNPNGVLFIKLGARLFVTTFGRGASGQLYKHTLARDFGIKAAMNMCGNEEVRQTQSQSMSIVPTHTARQVSRPVESFVFGMDESEDLKFISAHMKGNKNITLQGRDSLTIKTTGKEKLTWQGLIEKCREFSKAYDSRDFIDLFPTYRNFVELDKATKKILEDRLIGKLRKNNFDGIELWIPEFIPDDEFGFSYDDPDNQKQTIYAHLDPKQLETELDLAKSSIASLRRRQIYAYNFAEVRLLANKRWSIYGCLLAEDRIGRDAFILSDGDWRQVDADFYKSVIDFAKRKVKVADCEKDIAGLNIYDSKARKNLEGKFNDDACLIRKDTAIKFDRAQLRVGLSNKNKEFCDILDVTSDSRIRIINCKQLAGASSLNYLFSQAKFYCESFLKDETFLRDIRAHIANSGSSNRKYFLDRISSRIEKIRGEDFTVCLWILYDKRKKVPILAELPLMALFELKLMHEYMSRILKFREVVVRFVPVEQVVSALKEKKGTKAAAPPKRRRVREPA